MHDDTISLTQIGTSFKGNIPATTAWCAGRMGCWQPITHVRCAREIGINKILVRNCMAVSSEKCKNQYSIIHRQLGHMVLYGNDKPITHGKPYLHIISISCIKTLICNGTNCTFPSFVNRTLGMADISY